MMTGETLHMEKFASEISHRFTVSSTVISGEI